MPLTWTGFYIGAGLGPESGHIGFDNSNLIAVLSGPTHGFASAQVGYNMQAGSMVYGIEGDVGYSDLTD